MLLSIKLLSLFGILVFCISVNAQTPNPTAPPPTYPRVAGYVSILHPILTIDADATTFNFNGSYTVGFQFGLNLLKSDRLGFSFEISPTIKSGGGTDSKVSSVFFNPGLMFRRSHGFTMIGRMAFGTDGRYGCSAVFNKILVRKKDFSYFAATSVPFRFGNGKPASIGLGLQFGIVF